jgi:hypothetical protein
MLATTVSLAATTVAAGRRVPAPLVSLLLPSPWQQPLPLLLLLLLMPSLAVHS